MLGAISGGEVLHDVRKKTSPRERPAGMPEFCNPFTGRGRLVVADLLAVLTSDDALDDGGVRVLRDAVGVAIEIDAEHHVGMDRDQRVVRLALADALR